MSDFLIQRITAAGLRAGEFTSVFPEYYALQNVVENGAWHVQQNVFDHVVLVFEALEQELQLVDVHSAEKEKIAAYLTQEVGNLTREENLRVAALLHDIAKADKRDQFWQLFAQSVGTVAYELTLLMRADLHGCDLKRTSINQYEKYDAILLDMLNTRLPISYNLKPE